MSDIAGLLREAALHLRSATRVEDYPLCAKLEAAAAELDKAEPVAWAVVHGGVVSDIDITKIGAQSIADDFDAVEPLYRHPPSAPEGWLKVSEHEPPYGENILIALKLIVGDWFICYGFVQSDWSLRSVDDECVGYDIDDDAYWKRVQPPIDAALQATAQEEVK